MEEELYIMSILDDNIRLKNQDVYDIYTLKTNPEAYAHGNRTICPMEFHHWIIGMRQLILELEGVGYKEFLPLRRYMRETMRKKMMVFPLQLSNGYEIDIYYCVQRKCKQVPITVCSFKLMKKGETYVGF